jgi:hypothetical protein
VHVVAWLLIGVANIVTSWLVGDATSWTRWLTQHAFDLGHALALGVIVALVAEGWERWGPSERWIGDVALALAAIAIAQWVIKPDLWSAVGRLGLDDLWSPLTGVAAGAVALVVPATRRLSPWLLRIIDARVLCALAFALAVGHQLVLSQLYLGLHAYVTWCAALLLHADLSSMPWSERQLPRRHHIALRVALVMVAAAALLLRTPASVRMRMLEVPGSLVAQWRHLAAPLYALVEELPILSGLLGGGAPALPREPRPPTPRAELSWLPLDPIVVVITVDALRADVIEREAAALPTLTALRQQGAYFTHAWAPAPSTTPSVAALFAGRYASQLTWTPKKVKTRVALYPHLDTTPRVAELLLTRGVTSAVATHMDGMDPAFGLTKGFATQFDSSRDARAVGLAWTRWLEDHHQAASLSYLHFIDPHGPYDLAGTEGTPWQRYVGEVGLVDSAIRQMRRDAARLGVMERIIWIISADHGEAFGEHGSKRHGSTIYEEQVRVPLFICHPALTPRVVSDPVSLVDIAPTMLDVYDIAAPGAYMGVSLLPALGGAAVERRDPILLDAKRYAGVVFDDLTKLVVHRSGAAAFYDLRTDPGETDNIIDSHPSGLTRLDWFERYARNNGMQPFEWSR